MKKNSILLIHPLGYGQSKAENDVSRMANIMPPLGLASIAAYLDQYNIKNDIVDCYANPDSDGRIVEYLEKENPAFIGFSCTTSSFMDGVRISEIAKKTRPRVKINFGGVHVSALKEVILEEFPQIDYCVVGEGEQTLKELLCAEGDEIESIKNIILRRKDGTVFFTGFKKSRLDLDSLPFPAYKKLAGYPEAYKLPIFNYPKAPNASCISSRGCPYACSYCDRSVFQRSFRYNSARYVYDHLKYLKENFGIRHINFYDDQFTFNRQRVVDLTSMMIEDRLNMTFNCAARAEHLDFELLTLMKSAGCWMISLGIETGDPDLLARHRQNPDLEMMKERIFLIKKAGIRVKGLLMMGLPGETEQSIQRSREYVYSLPIDDFNLAKFTPFPGSPVYKQIKDQGEQLGTFEDDWGKMDCMQFLFIPKGLKLERMESLFIDFYKSHFMRPKVLMAYIAMLWKSPDSWVRFIKNLTGFLKFAFTNKRMG
ncbi:MAG: B12-binding domain-containing radical SAM protein [Proteobacteria bacterium]|nr:B12-binding domain-containing radical SAM protein [Pseudomonadota bacterium]MBU4472077.1 B12-binding domain-containing radical SAM protein [Pseudomonadota bacterium]MCG2752924.1 B12-binding domain-containing radical SAM protein [Desulfobacteraceae bacterium]